MYTNLGSRTDCAGSGRPLLAPGAGCPTIHGGILGFISVFLILAATTLAADCPDSATVKGVSYPVTERWCGKKLDTTLLAKPEQLAQLPDTLTYEDYRIYVLKETRDAFVRMADSARQSGVHLIADSGFRSPRFQERIIARRMAEGESFERVIRFVAPPGFSEHHTGRALDLVPSEARFVHTATYKWLTENAADFGFVESIPEDSTGKSYWESWHWYYTGDSD
ncbi:MAG: M15 family metallopeptidase [bacterium]|nr:M15 family metallopeptidase [bacterium]